MMDEPTIPARDYRSLALLCALGHRSRSAEDLLLLHPCRQRLLDCAGRTRDLPGLPDLFWDELFDMEVASLGRAAAVSQTFGTSPAQYWLRRRKLRQRQLWMRLPPVWIKLFQLPARELEAFCIKLGIDVIMQAISGQPGEALVELLKPVGITAARRVADRLRRPRAPLGSDLASRWLEQYRRTVRLKTEEGIVRLLGCAALSSLARTQSVFSSAAANLGRSNLMDVLQRTEPLDAKGEVESACLEDMVNELMQEFR
ncbi:MAG: hypothetical protein ABSH20_13920 [Tepidisphaeraceae bacterium]